MGKLEKIKAELAKLLIKYSVVKTDNGVLNYEGEDLVAGMDVYIENEEGEKIAAADGEYTTEDNKVITVKDGKVESIVDPVAEVETEEESSEEETPAEEVTEETPAEEEKPVEEEKPAEEEKPVDEEELEDEEPKETEEDAIAKIREEIDELYKLVDSILEKIGETRKEADERLSKIEKMSAAKPAAEEFEQLTVTKKTGDAKLDKFLTNYGK